MHYLIGLISIAAIIFLSWLCCFDRKAIRFRHVSIMILIQFFLAFLLLNTSIGNIIIGSISKGFQILLGYANEGVNFVFGNLTNVGQFNFFINVLLPIVFISALIGILQYLKILSFIIKGIGYLLSKVNGMGRLESYNAIAALILGQQEVFISIKKELPHLPERRLYTLCTSAMSTVSMAIVGAYMNILKPEYVVIAIILNLFGGFIIASLINPYQIDAQAQHLDEMPEENKQSFFQMLGEYILDGFKVAVIVGAMLIGFIALIAMINNIFAAIFGISFIQILGYMFSPLAYLMGISSPECIKAGEVMATKLMSNEFVAMDLFNQHLSYFSQRSQAILSVFLVSFANFSSIGIISGALRALDEKQGQAMAKHGLRLLYGASLVSLLSATVVGLVFDFHF
ncbi:MAG: NupC/NupG family nucleoside CNT transporter [Candidatus Schmidhempelia sp.]|nr:NupC/NupG family nucleoside CNT transporter [Candidatus Schmidhempelia sp.]